MNKTLLQASAISAIAIGLLALANVASADTVSGHLSTGIGGDVGTTTFDGVVIAPPAATPPAGAYTSAQSVSLTADGASSIHYTVDGTSPTCLTGSTYTGSIAVNSSLAIETLSCYPAGHASTVASYLYAINIPGNPNSVTLPGGGGGGGGGGSSSSSASTTSLFSKGDSNSDGKINIIDFVALMADWGYAGSGNQADFNRDGKVDIQDFVTLMANWTN